MRIEPYISIQKMMIWIIGKYGAQQMMLNQDRKKDTLIRKIVYLYGNG